MDLKKQKEIALKAFKHYAPEGYMVSDEVGEWVYFVEACSLAREEGFWEDLTITDEDRIVEHLQDFWKLYHGYLLERVEKFRGRYD